MNIFKYTIALIAGASLLFTIPSYSQAIKESTETVTQPAAVTGYKATLMKLMDKERKRFARSKKRAVPAALIHDPLLDQLAQEHAQRLAKRGGPVSMRSHCIGGSPPIRAEKHRTNEKGNTGYVGEIIAEGIGKPKAAFRLWKGSKSHRDVINNISRYKYVGFGKAKKY